MSKQENTAKQNHELRLANDKFSTVWSRVTGKNPSPIVAKNSGNTTSTKGGESLLPHPLPAVLESTIEREDALPTASMETTSTTTESAKEEPVENSSTHQSLVPVGLPTVLQGTVLDAQNMHQEKDFPPLEEVPYLGSQNRHFSGLLEELIEKEGASWFFYRQLSRKAGGNAAKSFALLARDCHKNSKQLIAAYFLITGIHMLPKERQGKFTLPSYLSALRQCFIKEQQLASLYHAAAAESDDTGLSALFTKLAETHLQHANKIRELVEQL